MYEYINVWLLNHRSRTNQHALHQLQRNLTPTRANAHLASRSSKSRIWHSPQSHSVTQAGSEILQTCTKRKPLHPCNFKNYNAPPSYLQIYLLSTTPTPSPTKPFYFNFHGLLPPTSEANLRKNCVPAPTPLPTIKETQDLRILLPSEWASCQLPRKKLVHWQKASGTPSTDRGHLVDFASDTVLRPKENDKILSTTATDPSGS